MFTKLDDKYNVLKLKFNKNIKFKAHSINLSNRPFWALKWHLIIPRYEFIIICDMIQYPFLYLK